MTSPVERLRAYLLPHGAPADVRRVVLFQEGEMWLQPGGRPLRFCAQQTMEVDRVGFVWRARARMAGILPVRITDAYENERGRLEARLLGFLRVAHATGPAADRGEALRYLAELPWVPHAIAANPELELTPVDVSQVDVACRVRGARVVVRIEVDEDGRPVRGRAETRPRDVGGTMVPTPWIVTYGAFEERAGVRIPVSGEAAWELEPGPLTYWRGRIVKYTPQESLP